MSSRKKPLQLLNKPALRRVLLVVIGLLIGTQVYRWNANTLAGNALPMPFGYGTAVVMSGSMEPTLSVGDMVVIRQEDAYEVGDVVVYQSRDSLVIHRIVSIGEDLFTARGDANNTDDDPVALRDIKGRLVLAVPFAGRILQILKSTPVMLVILVAAAVLMELSWQKEKEKDDEELDAIKEEIRKLQNELRDTKEGE